MQQSLVIDDALTIQTVETHHQACLLAADSEQLTGIDVSQVQRFDTAGLQFLLHWKRRTGLVFEGLDNPVIAIHLDRFGLTDYLGEAK
ncbi:STAS domain-containing protein [Salinibius halmophilus]|uniref:STAS domain-containing protein n=1 Tax=Salinibius halmophilus TaxID=1853216 RepID=UPI000E668E01|nr:STAS domain-containing protein [Salinibius halmophilus]